MGQRSKVSAAIFAAAAFCFLLPFVTVSCGGQKVATFSGVQLAFGTEVNQPQMFGPAQKKNVDAEPLATLAGLCALLGLGLGFIESSRAALGPAVSGVVGALFLLLVKSNMDDKIVKQGQGMLQVSYEAGFTLTLLLLIAGAALNGYGFFSQRARSAVASLPATPRPPGELVGPTASAPPASRGVCPHCGASTGATSKFCAGCGKPLSAGAAAGQNRP